MCVCVCGSVCDERWIFGGCEKKMYLPCFSFDHHNVNHTYPLACEMSKTQSIKHATRGELKQVSERERERERESVYNVAPSARGDTE